MQAIQLFGTNWQLLERIFPGRPRRALKNKFRAEQRRDAERMDCVLRGLPSSIEQYRQIIRILQARNMYLLARMLLVSAIFSAD